MPMDEPTVPHVPGRGGAAWFPPGLDSDHSWADIPGLPYRVLWKDGPKVGGMGQAWPGQHIHTGEPVYLKFLDPKSFSPGDEHWPLLKDYFAREARADLSGDHLLSSKTHAQLADPWRPVLVMEHAAASLADVRADLHRSGSRLPLAVIKRLVYQAAKGLQRLHEIHRLIHDDVKPGNLFLRLPAHSVYRGPATLEEQPFELAVGDFGFARKIGEPRPFPFGQDGYKALEQLRLDPAADPRTDLFGLGLVLQEFLRYSRDPVPLWPTELARRCQKPNLADRPLSTAVVAWELSSVRDQFRSHGIEPHKHRPFVNRARASQAFADFRRDPRLRLLHLKGDPGTGKTALMTHWADEVAPGAAYFLSCVGRASLETALRHLLQALQEAVAVNVKMPDHLDRWAVGEVLKAVVQAPGTPVPPGESLILYIDALDEADRPRDVAHLLPTELPEGVKLVVSSRHEPRFEDLEQAPDRREVRLDAPEDREQNLHEAGLFCRQRMAEALSEEEVAAVTDALEGNFQRIGIFCDYLWEKHEKGKLDHEKLKGELAELRRDFGGGTGGEWAFHRFYRKYVWEVALAACEHRPERINLLTRLAGLLAVAEAAVPLAVLAALTGQESEEAVEAALQPLRRNLRCEVVRGPGRELPAYRYAHKTIQTFITSSDGPLKNPDSESARRYRSQILEHYRQCGIHEWDHFGLGTFVRLCLRQGRAGWAVEAVTRPDFIQAVVNARDTSGLGVDGLREMVRRVREAVD
jgi:serine/threonine protein kinase